MPNDRELNWLDKKLVQCKALISLGIPQRASLPIDDYQAIFDAIKAAREALETAIVRNAPDVEPYLSAMRKIDTLGKQTDG